MQVSACAVYAGRHAVPVTLENPYVPGSAEISCTSENASTGITSSPAAASALNSAALYVVASAVPAALCPDTRNDGVRPRSGTFGIST